MNSVNTAVNELFARIDAGLGTNGRLRWWTFDRAPVESVQGRADKPALYIGAIGNDDTTTGSVISERKATVKMVVASKKRTLREGDAKVNEDRQGHLDNVGKLVDCVECSSSDQTLRDVLLSDTLAQPMTWTDSMTIATSQSYITMTTLRLVFRPVEKGSRAT